MDRVAHSRIGSATANRVRHGVIDLLVARVWISLQQCACSHDHASLAVTTLRNFFSQPRALTRMTAVGRESFDGGEIAPGRGRARDLARSDRLAVLQHRAGTANTHAAAKLCAGQAQCVSQNP